MCHLRLYNDDSDLGEGGSECLTVSKVRRDGVRANDALYRILIFTEKHIK